MHVLTIGTFDPFHAGHADLLNWCHQLGDRVTVGVLADDFVKVAKGYFPEFDQDDRREWMAHLADDAYVEYGTYDTHHGLKHSGRILEGDIDIVVVGSDWATKDYYQRLGLSQANLDALRVALCYVPRHLEVSSTEIKKAIRGG